MRLRRVLAIVLLTAFAGGFGLPLVGAGHQFNDDADWVVALGSANDTDSSVASDPHKTIDHCAICHWFHTLRAVSRSARFSIETGHSGIGVLASVDPSASSVGLRPFSARGPPSFFL